MYKRQLIITAKDFLGRRVSEVHCDAQPAERNIQTHAMINRAVQQQSHGRQLRYQAEPVSYTHLYQQDRYLCIPGVFFSYLYFPLFVDAFVSTEAEDGDTYSNAVVFDPCPHFGKF